MRDNFSTKTKDTLFKRASGRCSNPNCRKPTSGPHMEAHKIINIGVAAHITAAEKGGPRYDSNITPEERKAVENGIWLCQGCAKLIDSDEKRYTVDLIKKWKKLSEEAALLDIENWDKIYIKKITDKEIISFFSQCFDRPAFQDEFSQEGSNEAFDKAIEDTIIAINTGCLRDRNGNVLFKSYGKSYLLDSESRDKMDTIVELLRAIKSRYQLAIQLGQLHVGREYKGYQDYYFKYSNDELFRWFDNTRIEVINIFSDICKKFKIPCLKFPRKYRRWF